MLLFAPATVGAFLLACRWRPGWAVPVLLVAAAAYCLLSDPRALVWLAGSIVGNFALVRVLRALAERTPARRALTAAGIVLNLVPLIAFRWQEANVPVIGPAGGAVGHVSLAPLGLAFYTLGQISFLVDAQRPDTAMPGFTRYAAWASLFCQLPAGPVATWRMMEGRYASLERTMPAQTVVLRGATLFLAGLVKKTWIAEPLASMVDAVWPAAQAGPVAPAEAWLVAWGFLLQLYFDFSSYSDMAIGLALCLGIVLPINFNSPLKARSPGDYVGRWHVSLMMFVRAYVFEPAFRAARRLPIRPTPRRYATGWALATIAAFIAVGAWHSLAPSTLWAALVIGPLIVALQLMRSGPRVRGPVRRSVEAVAGRLFVLFAAAVFALFLRAGDMAVPARLVGSMVDAEAVAGQVGQVLHYGASLLAGGTVPLPDPLPVSGFPAAVAGPLLLAAGLIALGAPNTMEIFGLVTPSGRLATWLCWRRSARWGVATGVLLMLALVGISSPAPTHAFIYARF